MTRALTSGGGMTDLMSASRNTEFLSKSLTNDQVEGLKTYLGHDVANRALGAGDIAGHTVKDLLNARPQIGNEYPQILSYLAASEKQQGVRVYGNDRDPQPLDATQPGRLVPVDDLSHAQGHGDAGENVRDYLKSNFSMDDTQFRSYTAFLDLAGGKPPAALTAGGNGKAAGEPDALLDSLKGAMQGMPDGGKGGLYLPGTEVLGKLSQLLGYLDAYRNEPGADPSRFRGPDGRTLQDMMSEFDPDGAGSKSVDQYRRMAESDVQSLVQELMGKVVKTDMEGPNRYLFEMKLAWVKQREAAKAARKGGPAGMTLGNGRVRALNDELYRKLIIERHGPAERDKIELESDGAFFSLRGKPSDFNQKHYDPAIDTENMYFSAGMNLDNRPRDANR